VRVTAWRAATYIGSVSFVMLYSSCFVNSIRCHRHNPAVAMEPAVVRSAAPQRLTFAQQCSVCNEQSSLFS
jgi:hypothetical protein